MRSRPSLSIASVLLVSLLACLPAAADIAPEEVGAVARIPETRGPHWFWLSDVMLHRTALFDADSGRQLGTINAGSGGTGFVIYPLFSRDGREIYIAETYWSRGIRGERTDVVTVYDTSTLAPVAEIAIPPKRGEYFPGNASNALSDDGRFMAVLNITPASSITIVDVKERRFTAEIDTGGCGLLFAAGPRRFFMLCANGSALVVTLDEQGREASQARTKPFFEVLTDPLTEKAVRRGNEWIFTSFEGVVHTVDVAGAELTFGKTWSLLDDTDRSESWRIGGSQHLAIHTATGRLYALMHQGPRDTHKDPGTEVWVYDIAKQTRIQRIAMPSPVASFAAITMKLGRESATDRLARWLMETWLPNPGVERILVTQDEHPQLLVSAALPPALTVHDAMTGEVVREISEPGIAASLMFAP